MKVLRNIPVTSGLTDYTGIRVIKLRVCHDGIVIPLLSFLILSVAFYLKHDISETGLRLPTACRTACATE
jgi:hypothetical protein